MEQVDVAHLAEMVSRCKWHIVSLLRSVGGGHSGGSLSIIDVLVALYFGHIRVDPKDPEWELRDRVILSKAHASEALYAVLAEKGFFPKSWFGKSGEYGYPLQGHAERWATPGVEYSGGSLGQGLSFAIGVALAEKIREVQMGRGTMISPRTPRFRVYCILGDGECHEGQVWEGAMMASHYRLDSLISIVDYNKYSTDGTLSRLMSIEPFADKWRAFGWWVTEVDGHDIGQILGALRLSSNMFGDGRPKCIIAHTVKGKGVPAWEEPHLHNITGTVLEDGVAQAEKLLGKRKAR